MLTGCFGRQAPSLEYLEAHFVLFTFPAPDSLVGVSWYCLHHKGWQIGKGEGTASRLIPNHHLSGDPCCTSELGCRPHIPSLPAHIKQSLHKH